LDTAATIKEFHRQQAAQAKEKREADTQFSRGAQKQYASLTHHAEDKLVVPQMCAAHINIFLKVFVTENE